MNMNGESESSFSRFLITLGLIVVAAMGMRTISNSDFWTHLASGQWIAQHGVPRTDPFAFTLEGARWVDATWLYDRVLYALWDLGNAPLVVLAHVAAVVGAFLLLLPLARTWASRTSIAFALLLCAWLFAPRFAPAPSLIGVFLAALLVFCLCAPLRLPVKSALVIVLQVLWTNVHASFLLGPVLCLVFFIELLLKERTEPSEDGSTRLAWAGGLVVASALATLANPYGLGLHGWVLHAAGDPAQVYVQEWISPLSAQFAGAGYGRHLVTLALIIGAAGLVLEKRKLPVMLTTIAILGAFLVVLRSLRFLEFFAALAFPFLALSLSALGAALAIPMRSVLKERAAAGGALLRMVLLVLAVLSLAGLMTNAAYVGSGSLSTFGLRAELGMVPSATAPALRDPAFPRPAVNLPIDGGFLAWLGAGRVFTDPRGELYGEPFFREMAQCFVPTPTACDAVVAKWKPQSFIVNCVEPHSGTLIRNLLGAGHWSLAYFDGTTAVFVPSQPAFAKWIGDRALQQAGLQVLENEKTRVLGFGCGLRRWISPRLVGAANFYLALNRSREAADLYQLVLCGAPQMSGAWVNLGIAQIQLGDKDASVRSLETATRLAPRNGWAWLNLSRAYALAGRNEDARIAYRRGAELNGPAADAVSQGSAEGAKKDIPTAPGLQK